MRNRIPPERPKTRRQRIEIAFSRFLDALEENEHDAVHLHGTTLFEMGVRVSVEPQAVRILRRDRALDGNV